MMRNFLIRLPRNVKRSLLILVDVVSIFIVFWSALMIRSGSIFMPSEGYQLTNASGEDFYLAFAIITLITIPVFVMTRLYRSIMRYISLETYIKIVKATVISSLLSAVTIVYMGLPIPRTSILIYFVLMTMIMFYTRFTARNYLLNIKLHNHKNIFIYGVDESSQKVSEILKNTNDFNIVAFLSNDKKLNKTTVSEIPVYMSYSIEDLVKKYLIDEIIVMPEKSGSIQKHILKELESVQTKLRKIPNLNKIAKGIITAQDIKKIEIEDLLGREAVKSDPYLLKSCIENKIVLVTGCGGSIGSELSKQIIMLKPKSLLLVEQSEYFLYEIMQELNDIKKKKNINVPILSYQGSVGDEEFMSSVFLNKIDTVYHAAANKHVPLVEQNPVAAIKTNILGTHMLATMSYKNNVENFVLVSSDKAVRPTNIMGATKRFSEIILQSLQDQVNTLSANICRTKFCMVRFGNVLDTSGSVVPLFRKQIKNGGPVTVTDPEVIRYFMTIEEASELVIQAGSLSKGGDVFLLEMGQPVNILNLAKQMITLSGYEIKSNDNPLGDIEIEITGLREGEKLYEELLIGDNVKNTIHKHIMSAVEEKLTYEEVNHYIKKFKNISTSSTKKEIKELLQESIRSNLALKDNVVDIHQS